MVRRECLWCGNRGGDVADDPPQAPSVVATCHHRCFFTAARFLSPVPRSIRRVWQYRDGNRLLLLLSPHGPGMAAGNRSEERRVGKERSGGRRKGSAT